MMKISLPKRILSTLAAAFLFAIGLSGLFPGQTSAAGENYSWVDAQTIRVNGGDVRSTSLAGSTAPVLPGIPEVFRGEFTNTSEGNCTFNVDLTLSSNQSGTIRAYVTPVISDPDNPPNFCSESVRNSFNGTVSISGTRPTPGETQETDNQKVVDFTVRSHLPPAESPTTVTIHVTGPNGYVNDVVLDRNGSDSYYYRGFFMVEPGNYTACANAFIECVDFTKVKFQRLTLDYGEGFGNRTINVEVQLRFLGGAPDQIGAFEITLTNPDGSVVATTQTEPIDPPNQDTGLAPATGMESVYFARASFADVAPGQYRVCIPSANTCQDVTKEENVTENVTMTLDGSQSQAVLAAANGGDDDSQASCESEGGEMSWLLCPALRLADDFVGYVDSQIQSLLKVPNSYFQGDEATKLKETWARMRNIAYIILVPIMLIMVISTALGYSFIDAYTIKKALPRLFAAVLFIALSFELTTFMIEIINNVGTGILGLMTSSFNGGDITLASLFDPGFIEGGIFTTTVLVGVPAAFALAGIGVLLSYALVVGVILLLGFLALALRQFLLVALILLAPLAILAWIFPGNDKLWKLWWGTFSKLLLLFPLIMVLIGGGRVFAAVADEAQGSGIIETIIILTAYIAPYLFIPATFKFAGGLFGTVTGMVNDRGRGLFDRQRKYRQEAMKHRKELAGSENLFNKHSRFKRTAAFGNKLTSWAAFPGANARYKIGAEAQKRGIGLLSNVGGDIRSSIRNKTLEQTAKLSQEMQAAGMNDKGLAALSGRHTALSEKVQEQLKKQHPDLYGKALTKRADIEKVAQVMAAHGGETESIGANAMLGMADRISGLHHDTEMNYASVQAAAGMEWARQGFASSGDVSYIGNQLTSSGMDKDTAQALVTRTQLMGQSARPDLKAGYGVLYEQGTDGQPGRFVSGVADYDESGARVAGATDRGKKLIATIKQQDWMGAKSQAVQELSDNVVAVATQTDAAGNFTPEARAMMEQVALGASPLSSSDLGAKVEWKRISAAINEQTSGRADMDRLIESISQAQVGQAGRDAAAGGGAAGGGGDAGGGGGGGAAGGGGGGGGAA